jgi:leishmanolysin
MASSINFGYHAGCDFIYKKCISKQSTVSDEFCFPEDLQGPVGKGKSNSGTFCDFSLLNYGRCDVFDLGFAIPPEYQYFSQESVGGDTFCDFCPVNSKTFNCRDDSTPDLDSGEELGLESRCFEGTLSMSLSGLDTFASCHRVKCL